MWVDKEQFRDPNMSLRDKMSKYYEVKKSSYNEVCINRWGPRAVMAMVVTGAPLGILIVIPASYDNIFLQILMQIITAYAVFQIVNFSWKTSHTDSSFCSPDKTSQELANIVVQPDDVETKNYDISNRNHETESVGNGLQLRNRDESSNDTSNSPGTISPDEFSRYKQRGRAKGRYYTGLNYYVKFEDFNCKDDRKVSYQYWSWTPCIKCEKMRPPRCFHCPLCEKCILKRDHHCFLTGACIGVNNQKYFLTFLFWCIFATVDGLCHMYPYALKYIVPYVSYFDFLPPFCTIRFMFGYLSIFHAFFCFTFAALNIFCIIACAMTYPILGSTLSGETGFEKYKNIRLRDSRTVADRLMEVMGENWALTILLPFRRDHTISKEDPINWPTLQPE